MVFGLFGGERARLEIEAQRAVYAPGDTVNVRVAVHGVKEIKIQEMRVELLFDHVYEYEERTRDTAGDSRTRTVTETDHIAVGTERLLVGETVAEGHQSTHVVSFVIPPDAPPSAAGGITRIVWKAKATLDMPRARDVNAETDVTVIAPAAAFAGRVESAPEVRGGDEGAFSCTLTRRIARPGERFEGVFTATPSADLQVQGVRVELVRLERTFAPESGGFQARHGRTAEHVADRMELAGPSTLAGSVTRDFPFELAVPPDAAPTFATGHAELRWVVRAVLDRRLRSDHGVALEVAVSTEPVL